MSILDAQLGVGFLVGGSAAVASDDGSQVGNALQQLEAAVDWLEAIGAGSGAARSTFQGRDIARASRMNFARFASTRAIQSMPERYSRARAARSAALDDLGRPAFSPSTRGWSSGGRLGSTGTPTPWRPDVEMERRGMGRRVVGWLIRRGR